MTFSTTKHVAALTALLLVASPALAAAGLPGYQMGLPTEAPGAEYIKTGRLEAGIATALAVRPVENDAFLQQLSLCVAYSQMANYALAGTACNSAVTRANELQVSSGAVKREMRALALNNRAVMQISAGDKVAALQDLLLATRFAATELAAANLQRLTASINGVDAGQVALLQTE